MEAKNSTQINMPIQIYDFINRSIVDILKENFSISFENQENAVQRIELPDINSKEDFDSFVDNQQLDKNKTFVITGNQFLNYKLERNDDDFIEKLLNDYFSVQWKSEIDNQTIKIRLAHYSLRNTKKGIISFWYKNNFLTEEYFRKMKEKIFSDFDLIYILNLYGKGRSKLNNYFFFFFYNSETCILFFVKVEEKIEKQIKYFSLSDNNIFSINDKFNFLERNSIESITWQILLTNNHSFWGDFKLISFASVDRYADAKHILPIAIKQFKIANFNSIKYAEAVDIPVDTQWIFLTGENGFGKTSVLQAIAIGMYGDKDNTQLLVTNTNKKNGSFPICIAVEIKNNDKNIINNLYYDDFEKFEQFVLP